MQRLLGGVARAPADSLGTREAPHVALLPESAWAAVAPRARYGVPFARAMAGGASLAYLRAGREGAVAALGRRLAAVPSPEVDSLLAGAGFTRDAVVALAADVVAQRFSYVLLQASAPAIAGLHAAFHVLSRAGPRPAYTTLADIERHRPALGRDVADCWYQGQFVDAARARRATGSG